MKNLLPFSLFESKAITSEDWAGNWQDLPEWKLLQLMGFEILGTNSKGTVTIGSSYSGVRPRLTAGGYVRTADQGYVYQSSMTSGPKIMSSLLYYVIKRFAKKGIPLIPVKDLDDFMKANPEMIDVLLDLPKVREGVVSRTGITDPMGELYKRHGLTPSVVNWLNKSTGGEWEFNETTGEIDISGNFSSIAENKLGFRGIKFGEVSGHFNIQSAGLKSLEGAPRKVGGDFNCSLNNELTSLKGAPQEVGGHFNCLQNALTSLKEAPKRIKGIFNCGYNSLKTLEGAPEVVEGSFQCAGNPLISLAEAPESVGNFLIKNWNSERGFGILDWKQGWNKKGGAEFIKTVMSKLKEIEDLEYDKDKPVDKPRLKIMLLSMLGAKGAKDMSDYLLSKSLPPDEKFEIYGLIKDHMPDIWNAIKHKLDPDGATSDLLDLGF
jgi:hypothetical protein